MRFNLGMCPNLHPYSKVKRIQASDAEGNEADVVRIAAQQGQQSQDGFSLLFFFSNGLRQNQQV